MVKDKYLWQNMLPPFRGKGAATCRLAEVSNDRKRRKRETTAGLWRVLLCSRQPHFWVKLTGLQTRFRSMWNARALSRLHARNF